MTKVKKQQELASLLEQIEPSDILLDEEDKEWLQSTVGRENVEYEGNFIDSNNDEATS